MFKFKFSQLMRTKISLLYNFLRVLNRVKTINARWSSTVLFFVCRSSQKKKPKEQQKFPFTWRWWWWGIVLHMTFAYFYSYFCYCCYCCWPMAQTIIVNKCPNTNMINHSQPTDQPTNQATKSQTQTVAMDGISATTAEPTTTTISQRKKLQ